MAEKEKQLKVGDRVCDSYGRKGTVVRFGKYEAVAVKWDKKNRGEIWLTNYLSRLIKSSGFGVYIVSGFSKRKI